VAVPKQFLHAPRVHSLSEQQRHGRVGQVVDSDVVKSGGGKDLAIGALQVSGTHATNRTFRKRMGLLIGEGIAFCALWY
jgi:hypothetical protein